MEQIFRPSFKSSKTNAQVMGNEQAGYFIQDWQELRDQVRQLIIGDPRYKAIKANQAVRFMPPQSTTDSKDPPK